MKSRIIFCFLLLVFIVAGLNADERGPVVVSPGSDVGIAVIGESCPTFSWTAVEWAKGYRIEIFDAFTAEVLSYQDMAAKAPPVLIKEIQGRALAWTPSSDEQLSNGGVYVWFVQAMDAYGTAKWSEGRSFIVIIEDRIARVIDKVTETLKVNGVSKDVINKVLSDMSPAKEKSNIGAEGSQNNGYKTQDKIGTQGHEGENTLYGLAAGASLTTGLYNTFIGMWAGYSQDSGQYNTFLGDNAGFFNTVNNNTFIGALAGRWNTTGEDNTFMGYRAGYWNTGGDDNTFIGMDAGYSNVASWNTFIGRDAGNANSIGDGNTFMGYRAGYRNTTGYRNTFIGEIAGVENTTGRWNTFIGQKAGHYNIDGYFNTFIGVAAGEGNTSGVANTFVGLNAGRSNTIGSSNSFVGASAGFNNSGNYNTYVGYQAGSNNFTGNANVFLGRMAGYNETGSDRLYIDNSDTSLPLIYGEFDNDIVTINGSLEANSTNINGSLDVDNNVTISGKLGIGTQSPGYNLEVKAMGENAIFLLNRTDGVKAGYAAYSDNALLGTVTSHPLMFAVGYAWKMRLNTDNSLVMSNGAQCTAGGVWQDASSRAYKENILNLTVEEAKDALLELIPVRYNYKNDQEDEHLGFIAEDVPELVASKDRKGMSPMDVVAVLTKVVQEQQATLVEQQDTIAELQERIAKLENKSQ